MELIYYVLKFSDYSVIDVAILINFIDKAEVSNLKLQLAIKSDL